MKNTESRVIGLDCHPDSFTAALLKGQIPAQAITEKVFNKVPIKQLAKWAAEHTKESDTIVLEASGNSFQIVRVLEALKRRALVLESCHLGKLKEAHANNDKISAVRIGKAYLAGTAKEVWVPDLKTQERRDWMHANRKCVKRTTQVNNRLLSYLSDNDVRLEEDLEFEQPEQTEKALRKVRTWSSRQWQVIQGLLLDIRHAQEQRQRWRSLMAQEVLNDPMLLSLVRLCGVRDVVAFALGAVIGDITRFSSPKKLVSYFGLNPALDESGEGKWQGGIGGHGHKYMRSLLIEAGHSILRSKHPMAQWGKRLLARTSQKNLVAAALARRLTVAVWYLMNGRWSEVEEIDSRLSKKIGKIITQIGPDNITAQGKTRKELRTQAVDSLKTRRTYVLDRDKKLEPGRCPEPRPTPTSLTPSDTVSSRLPQGVEAPG